MRIGESEARDSMYRLRDEDPVLAAPAGRHSVYVDFEDLLALVVPA